MYLIDVLALRAGNEKGEDEADTVGCCSLRCEHVTLQPPNILSFDFLGKDSIRYFKQVEVDPQVFKNMRIFKQNKTDDDALLDRVHVRLHLPPREPLGPDPHPPRPIDLQVERSPQRVHEGAYRESLPYLQRFADFPNSARREDSAQRLRPRETQRVQRSQQNGCHPL